MEETKKLPLRFVYLTKPLPGSDRRNGIGLMSKILDELGMDRKRCKSVFLSTFSDGKKPKASDIEANREEFMKSVGDEPCVLVAMGSTAMNPLTKNAYPISITRGEALPTTEDMQMPEGSFVFGTFDPLTVWNDPGCEDLFRRDMRHLVAFANGTPEEDPKVETTIVHTPQEVEAFTTLLPELWATVSPDDRFLVVDCEWQGKNWLDPDRYIRTVQIGYAPGKSLVIELYRENEDFTKTDIWPRKVAERRAMVRDRLLNPVCMCADMDGMWDALRSLLQDAGHPIVGHNIIADWHWLKSFGVDIRANVVYDTMLAEHLINSDGPFRLDEVAMRRTHFGRYCVAVDLWVHKHKEFCKEGYGAVPHDILLPYGGADVEAPRLIMKAQFPILQEYGMLERRGPNKEYPSLLDSTLLNELATDELESSGLPVDRQRLEELIEAYQGMRAQLLSEITLMAMGLGMPDFNPNSQDQMRKLLFGVLCLTPVKTTGGQSWGDAAGNAGLDSDDEPASSTDKSVLEMLQGEHPIVKKLLQFKRIDQACKTWLRHPDEDGEGGLEPLIWADGKFHPTFLPLTSTGRYKSSSPNSFDIIQNICYTSTNRS